MRRAAGAAKSFHTALDPPGGARRLSLALLSDWYEQKYAMLIARVYSRWGHAEDHRFLVEHRMLLQRD
jgi:hypothetical protein